MLSWEVSMNHLKGRKRAESRLAKIGRRVYYLILKGSCVKYFGKEGHRFRSQPID
jgi:hypothetical protein